MLWNNAGVTQIVTLKLLGCFLLWFFYTRTDLKRKILFYYNLGISATALFFSLFLTDYILIEVSLNLMNILK